MNSTAFAPSPTVPGKALASPTGSKLAQSAVILVVGVVAALARLLVSSPPRLPWCGEQHFHQRKYIVTQTVLILTSVATIALGFSFSGQDRKLLLEAMPVVAFPYILALRLGWQGLGDNTVQLTSLGVGTATRRGFSILAQTALLLAAFGGVALQAVYSEPVQAALNLVAIVSLQFGVHVNALQPASTQDGTTLGRATIPSPCIGFKTRGYGVINRQLWQLQLVATQWSMLATWKDKMPKFRYLAAKGDFLQFVSKFVPLIQEAAERDGEGIGWDPDTVEEEFSSWLEALLRAEAGKILKDTGNDPEGLRGRPSIDVWYVLAVLERISFKSSTVMHRPLAAPEAAPAPAPRLGERNEGPPLNVHHFALRHLCTYYNPDKLVNLTTDGGLLTLVDIVPPEFLNRLYEELEGPHGTAPGLKPADMDLVRRVYAQYPVGKWPDEETLKWDDRAMGVALAKSYTSSIPCIMLAVLEFLWVREGESADRRAGRAGDKLLHVSPESDRVKQCLLGQVLATQALGMF